MKPANEHRMPRPSLAKVVIAGWLLPGLGHWLVGERRRAVWLLVGIYGLMLVGLLVGGINVIDRREATLWYLGEVCIGPAAVGVDVLNQLLNERVVVSVGRPHELGTLYCTLAGVLNVLAILDAFGRASGSVTDQEERTG